MCKTVKEALWQNYEDVEKKLKGLDVKNDNYAILLDERDKIRGQLIKIEQLEQDKIIKDGQLDFEKQNEFIKNSISIISFSLNLIVCVGMAAKTFNFDNNSAITSTMGRGILNNFIPKLFRRWLVYKRREYYKHSSFNFYLYLERRINIWIILQNLLKNIHLQY